MCPRPGRLGRLSGPPRPRQVRLHGPNARVRQVRARSRKLAAPKRLLRLQAAPGRPQAEPQRRIRPDRSRPDVVPAGQRFPAGERWLRPVDPPGKESGARAHPDTPLGPGLDALRGRDTNPAGDDEVPAWRGSGQSGSPGCERPSASPPRARSGRTPGALADETLASAWPRQSESAGSALADDRSWSVAIVSRTSVERPAFSSPASTPPPARLWCCSRWTASWSPLTHRVVLQAASGVRSGSASWAVVSRPRRDGRAG